jgi:hypothetical protein
MCPATITTTISCYPEALHFQHCNITHKTMQQAAAISSSHHAHLVPEHAAARQIVHVQPLARARRLGASREPADNTASTPRKQQTTASLLMSWLCVST